MNRHPIAVTTALATILLAHAPSHAVPVAYDDGGTHVLEENNPPPNGNLLQGIRLDNATSLTINDVNSNGQPVIGFPVTDVALEVLRGSHVEVNGGTFVHGQLLVDSITPSQNDPNNPSSLQINGGRFEEDIEIVAYGNSSLNIAGGDFVGRPFIPGVGTDTTAIRAFSTAPVTISGGHFSNPGRVVLAAGSNSDMLVTGGLFDSDSLVVTGEIELLGGQFEPRTLSIGGSDESQFLARGVELGREGVTERMSFDNRGNAYVRFENTLTVTVHYRMDISEASIISWLQSEIRAENAVSIDALDDTILDLDRVTMDSGANRILMRGQSARITESDFIARGDNTLHVLSPVLGADTTLSIDNSTFVASFLNSIIAERGGLAELSAVNLNSAMDNRVIVRPNSTIRIYNGEFSAMTGNTFDVGGHVEIDGTRFTGPVEFDVTARGLLDIRAGEFPEDTSLIIGGGSGPRAIVTVHGFSFALTDAGAETRLGQMFESDELVLFDQPAGIDLLSQFGSTLTGRLSDGSPFSFDISVLDNVSNLGQLRLVRAVSEPSANAIFIFALLAVASRCRATLRL